MGGILKLQEQILGYVQDGRYDAGAWMRKSGVLSDYEYQLANP